MAQPNIVFLPGIFGSTIGTKVFGGGLDIEVWLTPGFAATAQLLQLQLAADGLSPGPLTWGIPWTAQSLYAVEYSPLGLYMRSRGWNVLDAPYDWRLSVLVSARNVLATIQAAFGQQPIIFVAHSMGGLVARAVYALLVQAGLGGQVAGIVTLGTPHFGSWDAVRGFFGLPYLYRVLLWAAGLLAPANPFYRPDFLDVILASWPGWYELLPWRDFGPLALADPATAQALYKAPTYIGGNRYISQAWLNAAAVTQDSLVNAFPPNLCRCIFGNGWRTPYEVNPPQALSGESGYLYNGAGDSQVPSSYAQLPFQPAIPVPVPHSKLPLDPKVWDAVRWSVQSLVGPGA
jgi:pimeloyl-ACP methyl ester carboxylesterase